MNLDLKSPIKRWDEAIPMGNGLLGLLLWGEAKKINLSIDRGDLWDSRLPSVSHKPSWNWKRLQNLVKNNQTDLIKKEFEDFYHSDPFPTKLPAGRIELQIENNCEIKNFHLNLKTAESTIQTNRGFIRFLCSETPSLIIGESQNLSFKFKIIPPPFALIKDQNVNKTSDLTEMDLRRLNYPAPHQYSWKHGKIYLQKSTTDYRYALIVGQYKNRIAITVTHNQQSSYWLEEAQEQVKEALNHPFKFYQKPNRKWWNRFWKKSSIRLPDSKIQKHYEFCQYLYGSGSRKGSPPLALQGLWTADEGTIPPWKGDYHHDLNTQLTYWPALTANRLESSEPFLDLMWTSLKEHRNYAKTFYGLTSGAVVASVMDINGKQMGGWAPYAYSPTNGAWVAHHFYLQWKYSNCTQFLQEKAYPYCKAIGEGLQGLLKKNSSGFLKLPLSSSPEIHNNWKQSYLKPNSNYDQSLILWLFEALSEMAKELKLKEDLKSWTNTQSHLAPLSIGKSMDKYQMIPGEVLLIAPEEPLLESHRHHAHLMAVHPLGIFHVEQSKNTKEIIKNTLLQLDLYGTGLWVGYSYSWGACIAARAKEPERALGYLHRFLENYISRNGFHLNGDYQNKGESVFKYRPFTLEGNFALAEAVHEMLIQSWNGVIRLFPAIPKEWGNVSFKNLRTQGGFLVSAEYKNKEITKVEIRSIKCAILRLDLSLSKLQWNKKMKINSKSLEIKLENGETLRLNPAK